MKKLRPSWRNIYTFGLTIFALHAFVTPSSLMAQNVAGTDQIIEENSEYLFGFSALCGDNSLTLGLASGGTATLRTSASPIAGIYNQGWWSGASNFTNSIPNANYICGDLSDNGSIILSNFFTFDVSALQGQTVTSAQFNVKIFGGRSSSRRAFQTYSIYDVSTPALVLNSTVGFSAAIHLDLASGLNYGNFDIPTNSGGCATRPLTLNSLAIAAINNAIAAGDQFFSIGGTLFPMIIDNDNDGVDDAIDPDPNDPFICGDFDGDDCDDCSIGVDGFGPLPDFDPNNDGPDFDGDGLCDFGDPDDDNDGVMDPDDPEPFNPFICGDVDGDNCDDCSIGVDGIGPLPDFDPNNDGPDFDGDGLCDFGDPDDDNDGVDDPDDACPESDTTPTIIIDGVDTGVDNEVLADGCTIADLIAANLSDDPTTRDIVQFLLTLKHVGIFTGQDLAAILRALNSH